VVGYIGAGVMVGPHTAGPTVAGIHDIEMLADIGVALLLFTVGLEFPLPKLKPVQRLAVVGTGLQILATIGLGLALGRWMGWSWQDCLWFGCLISLSSTMVVLKVLMERGYLHTLASRVMIGMLVAQDLAMVPMMVLLPALGGASRNLGRAGLEVLLAVAFVVSVLVFGARLLPWLMARIASWGSRELFLLSVMAVGLGVGYASYALGLTLAFGAFLAGIVLSESDYSHQAISDVTPLRDVFAMFFFVAVGMLVDPAFLWGKAPFILALLVLVLAGKGLLLAGLARAFGYGNIVPFAVGLYLAGVGEFSFVLARLGASSGLLGPEAYSYGLTIAVLSMALTPLLSSATGPLYQAWRRRYPREVLSTLSLPPEAMGPHVIIGGFGRVGRFAARVLHSQGRKFVLIEPDPRRLAEAQAEGYPVVGGEVQSPQVLQAAGIDQCPLVILTLPDPVGVRQAVSSVRRSNPSTVIVALAQSMENLEDLARLGVARAVQPEMEAALELVRQSLALLGADPEQLERFSREVRREHYHLISQGAGEEELRASLKPEGDTRPAQALRGPGAERVGG
jgi:CPA2 family monovalent cation:H+ antiporter-2